MNAQCPNSNEYPTPNDQSDDMAVSICCVHFIVTHQLLASTAAVSAYLARLAVDKCGHSLIPLQYLSS